jgi:hypothetical protein
MGSCRMRSSGLSGASGCSNWKSSSTRMNASMCPRPDAACASFASLMGAPISIEMVFAISSLRRS